MLGRQVGTSLLRLPQYARLSLRSSPSQLHRSDLLVRTLGSSASRAYAQTPNKPGRPKKAVGEPSRPVKRDVKRTAKDPSDKSSEPAVEKVEAAKKKAAARPKTAAKPRPIPKGRAKAKPKPEPKKKEPKVLSEEQQAARSRRRDFLEMKELRRLAMKRPAARNFTGHGVFLKENSPKFNATLDPSAPRTENFIKTSQEMVRQWKNVTPAEREHYNHLARQLTEARDAEFKAWLESFAPETINIANRARHELRKRGRAKYLPIRDHRHVKVPKTDFVLFNVDRHASGDFTGIKLTERTKLIAQEWKALNEEEKKKYHDLFEQERARYVEERNKTYSELARDVMNTPITKMIEPKRKTRTAYASRAAVAAPA